MPSDGFKPGQYAGEATSLSASVPRSLRNAVADHAARYQGGDVDRAVAELLERGLHHSFLERFESTMRRELRAGK